MKKVASYPYPKENSCHKYNATLFLIFRLLTSSRIQDLQPLEASGYFYQQGSTLNLSVDAGFKKRQKEFLKENSTTVYSGEAVTLCGQIYHDLISCEAGVPPGKIVIQTFMKNLKDTFHFPEEFHLDLI